ncbi:hypothetical protein [Paracoccus sp. PAR01]|uniref:hypothetical protein n=1 Tax=Paracoccus sp. PAR01 TaxID=2769282 RepID=UPI00177E1F47|nr:hypothetical protein [Paracoccus sp. PAR01]MBD9529701.1 hypothetical protein [Paracoccus sp. PAR01]
MPRSRRGGGAGSGKTILLVALAAVMVVGVGGLFWWSNRTARASALDPETLCPEAGPAGMTAILMDLTDPLSHAQASQLLAWLEKEVDDAPRGTQFTMGVVSEDLANFHATPALCKPQDKASASSLTQNPELIGRRYDELFLKPLEANIRELTTATAAKHSPIMESLQSLVADTPGFVTFEGPRRIVLVSDLLQNSEALSFYRGGNWDSFRKSPGYQRLGSTLTEAEVAIYQVPRPLEGVRDPVVLEDFWLRYFERQGSHKPAYKRLGDL